MIDWVTIQGFRSVRNVERLRLGPINALVGANGSGKSNFIRAFELLQAICEESLQHYVLQSGGADRLLHFGAKETDRVVIRISFADSGSETRYQVELAHGEDDSLHICGEQVYLLDPDGPNRSRHKLLWSEERDRRESGLFSLDGSERPADADRLRKYLKSWKIYHFHDTGPFSPFRKTNQLHDNRELRPDGANLAAFLYLLRVKYESSYHLIRRTIRLIAPFFKDFVLEPEELNEETLHFGWRAEGSDTVFRASSLSDGSIRFIALTTLLLQPEKFRPSTILLDEPELGLHPAAITLLASLIRQASKKNQIIFATQSPPLLDHFLPEDVLVAERVTGGTQINRREDDKERLVKWLENYSLGQLWEKNEIGGRPVPETMAAGIQK